MATRDDLFPGKYLKASDLPPGGMTVKIAKIEYDVLMGQGPKQERKTVLYFRAVEKGLVLNMTKFDAISQALNEFDTNNWIGKVIHIDPGKTTMGGKLVDCIYCRAAKAKTPAQPVQPPPTAPTASTLSEAEEQAYADALSRDEAYADENGELSFNDDPSS